MKILQVVHAYPPHSRAGVETFTQSLSTELSKEHEIQILAFDLSAPKESRGKVSKRKQGAIQFHFFANPTSKEKKRKHAPIEQYFKELLKTEKPDIIHFQHLGRFPPSLPSIAREQQIPYAVSLHDFWYLCPTVNLFEGDKTACTGPEKRKCFQCIHGKAAKRVLDYFELRSLDGRLQNNQQILKEAALIIAVSHNTRWVHESYGAPAEKTIVLPPALNLNNYKSAGPRGRVSQSGPLQVAFMGFANRIKGFHVLLNALKNTKEALALTVYGNVGPEFVAATTRAIKEDQLNYQHYGSYERSDLPEILSRMDVVVLPSLCYETYGLVIDEAFSAGIPVVASRIGGMQERVFERRTGFLFPPGDSQRLATILDQLAMDYKESCKDMDFRNQVPSFQSNVKTIVEHYKNLVSDKPQQPAEIERQQRLETINGLDSSENNHPIILGKEESKEISSPAIMTRKRLIDLLLAVPTIHNVLLGGKYSRLLPIEGQLLGYQFSIFNDGQFSADSMNDVDPRPLITPEQLGEISFDAVIYEGLLNMEKPLLKLDDLSKALPKGAFLILSKFFNEPVAPLEIELWDDGLPELKDAMKNYGFRWSTTRRSPDRCYYMFQFGLQGTPISI